MTAQNRATLKAVFETGDVPTGTDYENLIDSFISLVDTSAQSVDSAITFAGSAAFTGTVTAATAKVLGGVSVSGALSANTINVSGAMTAGSINVLGAFAVSGAVSVAGGANVSGAMTAGSMAVLGAMRVSAATSLEGALAVVTAQTTATASGAAGGSTVPSTAAKYLKVSVSGVTYNIALYPSV